MAKHVLLFRSISERDSPRSFLADLRRKARLYYDDFKSFVHVHCHDLDNRRYHLRVHIKDERVIEKILEVSERTSDGSG